MQKYRNASQQLRIEFFQIEADLYQQITQIVVNQFQLAPVGEPASGPDRPPISVPVVMRALGNQHCFSGRRT